MLPLMVIPGVGSQIYRGLATVIIGGMVLSGIFTLILLPAILRLPPLEVLQNFRGLPQKLIDKQGVPADA
jgi:Cu/Ag efflux pump CusA